MSKALQKLKRRAGQPTSTSSVVLHGGPMDGWYVRRNAPCLRRAWGTISGYPGRAYVKGDKPDKLGIEHAYWKKVS